MMSPPRLPQLLRFLVVGSLNTGASYGAYVLLLALGLHFSVASLGALIFGILLSFTTQGRFVFGNNGIGRFPRFVAVWALLYFANIALIGAFAGMGINAYLGGALALVPITALSFLLQRHFVFSPTPPARHCD
ncbi:hypothetical protein CJ010_19995 [Azoarcus sp. DD4]|uniref:GtrA family protein n=1 Tax=Azoarcus sp. DD4 TaxID=2027405 RepID=UPI001127556E|nr:GtrA family protein [Azoarcus sp. DD4]QDF98656.1 hypothetical protein CJ010_19995 [Azoarcus sp. DD4]